jgi:hypothetical protein
MDPQLTYDDRQEIIRLAEGYGLRPEKDGLYQLLRKMEADGQHEELRKKIDAVIARQESVTSSVFIGPFTRDV